MLWSVVPRMLRPLGGPELQRGILCVNSSYAFVQRDHAVISFLASRPDLIQCNIREQTMIDGHYKISNGILHFVCGQLAKLDVARLQRWIREVWMSRIELVRERKRIALAMCLHSRLGQAAPLSALGGDLVALVVSRLKDVGDDRRWRGATPRTTVVPRARAALVWTDLSKIDLNKLNGR